MTTPSQPTTRRDALLALAVLPPLLGPRIARAQTPNKVWRIGYLGPSAETAPQLPRAFQEGLAALGYVEGRNILIEYRWTNAGTQMNDAGVLLAHARDLVARKVDVLAASIDPAILAARQATDEVPIVMLNVSDPIELGLVKTLRRPGGNVTGMTRLSPELIGRNLQTLREVVPKVSRVGLLTSAPNAMSQSVVGNAQQAARSLGIGLQVFDLSSPAEWDATFAALKHKGVEALLVADTGGGIFFTQRARLADLAIAQRLPTIFANTEIVEAGGLMSYSPPAPENYRHAAVFIDKILRGTKPGDIPVEQPTKFELVINLRTAKALHLALPQSLLIRADRLIE
ncbi:MAG TPA: ABC transporter substrate-binding protein [Burkholderiaceae bacterium]|nr:ABC transporter substrate-binding protein [Burkholderiaceae bacterium]